MRSSSMLSFIVCAFAYTCTAEEACAANMEEGSDGACMLQSGVGVLAQHDEDQHAAKKEEHHVDAKKVDHHVAAKKEEQHVVAADKWPVIDTKGFADILDKVGSAVGGGAKLEDDFGKVKEAVIEFTTEIKHAIKTLKSSVKPSEGVDQIKAQVEVFYRSCHAAATKLYNALMKVEADFFTGAFGSMAPATFKSSIKKTMDLITGQAKHFAASFNHAADKLSNTFNHTKTCELVSHQLHKMQEKVHKLVASLTGMTKKGLDKDILKAKELLPEIIKKKIDDVLDKATEAFDDLKAKVAPIGQEISHGVASAFQGHCVGIKLESGAGRVEVGLLSALVMGMFAFAA